jgi:hypothetical protein
MEQPQKPLNMATLLQNKIAQDKETRSGHRPSVSNPRQESDVRKDPPKSDDIDRERENRIMEISSLSQIDIAIWKSENAGLEDEFSALETILSTYFDLQTSDLGGDEVSCMDAKCASSDGSHNRALVLSDAVRYIQYLEELQRHLFDEKSTLEDKVSGWEKKGLKVVGRY